MKRTETRKIKVGNLFVGGDKKEISHSMTITKTMNIEATTKQKIGPIVPFQKYLLINL